MNGSDRERATDVSVLLAASEAGCAPLHKDLVSLGFSVCAEEHDAAGAVAAAVSEEPDLCVLAADLRGSAVVATGRITDAVPRARVVILAEPCDEDDCLTYLMAGAAGYLERDIARHALGAALRDAVAGETVVPASAKHRLLDELRSELL